MGRRRAWAERVPPRGNSPLALALLVVVCTTGCAYDVAGGRDRSDDPAADGGNGPDAGGPAGCGSCVDFPLSTCSSDGRSVLVFQDPGACRDGRCDYSPREEPCDEGCEAGRCLNCTPACAGKTCGSDGCGGRCGGACDERPVPSCVNGTTLRSWASVGQCSEGRCVYAPKDTTCADGCEDGACLNCTPSCADKECGGDGCGGSCGTCQSPPAPTCLDANTQRSYASLGTCSDGRCDYTPIDTGCTHGCADGACQGCTPSCVGRECGSDGCGGICGAGTCTTPPPATCKNTTTLETRGPTGTCSAGVCSYAATTRTCDYSCVNGACQACEPESDAELCSVAGTTCGGISATDRCGTTRAVNCGPCPDYEWARWPIPPESPTDYTATADTVKDNVTGLTWQRGVPTPEYTWANAKTYCAGLSLGGQSGWRLPTFIELESILDRTRVGPAINRTAFPSTPNGEYWSSSAGTQSTGCAWAVHFGQGSTICYSPGTEFRVRCVR